MIGGIKVTDFRTLHEDGVLKDVLDYISGKPGTGNAVSSLVTGAENFLKGRKADKTYIMDSNIATKVIFMQNDQIITIKQK